MNSGTARVGGKGHREKGLDLGDISRNNLLNFSIDNTGNKRKDLEGRFKDTNMISGVNFLFIVNKQFGDSCPISRNLYIREQKSIWEEGGILFQRQVQDDSRLFKQSVTF